jgi:cytochrome c553
MRPLTALALLGLMTLPINAQTLPDWAYPVNPPPKPVDNTMPKHLAGSNKTYTQAQIDDGYNPPDWYPQDHPPMPDVVAHGRKDAEARACALCHLTSGGGHPESAGIAGLPAGYIIRQMQEFKSGARKGGRAVAMLPISKALNEADFKAAAEYFAALKAPVWYKVVETDVVPSRRARRSSPRAQAEEPSRVRSAMVPTSRASGTFRPSSDVHRCTSTASSMTSRSAPAPAP